MRQVDKALDAGAARLSQVRRGEDWIEGVCRGRRVGFVVRGAGWDVVVPLAHIPVVIDVSHHLVLYAGRLPGERAAVGMIEVGDPDFERRFEVTGAPEEMVRATLDAPMRRRLLALNPAQVAVQPTELRLTRRYGYYYAEPDDIQSAIELAVDWATALEARVATGERALIIRATTGLPYRARPDAAIVRAVHARDSAQMRRVMARLRRRRRRRAAMKAAGFVGALFWLIGLFFS